MKRFLTSIGLLLTVASCIYPYDPQMPDTVEEALVVEGYITVGDTTTVTLGYLLPLDGGYSVRRASGKAYVEDDAGTVYSGSGNTVIRIDTEKAPGDRKYRLVVEADGKTYESGWMTPLEPPAIDNVRFTADELSVYALVSFTDPEGGSRFTAVSFEEDWEFHADWLKNYDYDPETNLVSPVDRPDMAHYWCWKSYKATSYSLVDSHDLGGKVVDYTFRSFPRTNNRNHRKYRVKVKVWNLGGEEYRFRKLLDENASIGGNLFTPEPGEIAGNLVCTSDPSVKVYGYAGISLVNTRYFYMDGSFWRYDASPLTIVDPDFYDLYYNRGYQPVEYYKVAGEGGIGWGLPFCYDCIEAGGTQVEPENWE